MARIATYPVDAIPTINDKVIGTDVDNELITKNYRIGDILALVPGGSASVQSLNTLTGDLNLIGAGGISISASGTDITITGSGGGGIQTIDGATGPDIDLAGKGGITITAVGNLINIDGSGISGGNPGTPVNGVQFNDGGIFGASEFFTVDLKGFANPVVNIGLDQNIKGQLNIFSGTGEGSFYGETRYYDAIGSGQFASWASPGSIQKQSYAVALPELEPVSGQALVIDKAPTGGAPYTSVWSTVGGGGTDDKFKIDAADATSGYWTDKVTIGSGLSGSINTDVSGVKTLTISAVSYNMVNSIKVGSTSSSGTFEFTGSGVSMTTGGAGQPQNIVDFDYQDVLVSGTNIKTINNLSLLGSGNLDISGGTTEAAGSGGQIQFNDGNTPAGFEADTNLNWDTTNNVLVVGKETAPTNQEGIIHLKGNGSTEGGKLKLQTGAGKGSPVDIILQAPDSGSAQTISLPGTLATSTAQVLGIDSINGSTVATKWVTSSGGVTDVTASTPLSSTQGATPDISISKSDINTDGYLSSTDFATFNDKQEALVSGTNIKTINGNSVLGGGNLAITATATPGGANTNVQFHNASGQLDGDSQFTYVLDSVNKIATVKIGNESSPSLTYGVLRLDGNSSSEGGKIELRTGSSKGAAPETVTLQAPDQGVAQEISLPESLPTASTQILGIKSISGTEVQTQWEDPSGGTSLNYTSYEALFSTTGGVVSVRELSNTTALTFGWVDNQNGTLAIKISGTLTEAQNVFVLLNGYGGDKGGIVQCYFGGFDRGAKEIKVDIYDETLTNQAVDIRQGNFELRVY